MLAKCPPPDVRDRLQVQHRRQRNRPRAAEPAPPQHRAGSANADGDRPFRPFAKPMLFMPRSTIRIEVEEISDGPLYGYEFRRAPGGGSAPSSSSCFTATRYWLRDRESHDAGPAPSHRADTGYLTPAASVAFRRTPTTSTSPASSRRRQLRARRSSWRVTSFIPSTAAPCSTSLSTRSRPGPAARKSSGRPATSG